jgi:hypothetical protein
VVAFARNRQDSIAAQNTFGKNITLKKGGVLTLSGTWVATVSLQRKGQDGNWVDVTSNTGTATTFTANGTYTIAPAETAADYRWGIKTGNYTSGTVVGLIEGR